MKNKYTKKLIFSLATIFMVVSLVVVSAFAWFTGVKKSTGIEMSGNSDFSIHGYVLRYYESDTMEKDIFVPEGGKYPIDMAESGALVGDDDSLSNLDNTNYLKFIFVIQNNSGDFGCQMSFRLSNFANYIFSFFDDYKLEYDDIKTSDTDIFSKRNELKSLAKQYNAKFSLYFADIEYCLGNDYDPSSSDYSFSKGGEYISLTQENNPFLWNYSSSERVIDKAFTIPKGQTATLSFKIKSQQSNESITSYRSWVEDSYGVNYLALNKFETSFTSLSEENKAIINDYLEYFVSTEINTIYNESSTVIEETKLLIDYIEFIGEMIV